MGSKGARLMGSSVDDEFGLKCSGVRIDLDRIGSKIKVNLSKDQS